MTGSRTARALRGLLRDESGIALPVAILVTVVGLAIATVPIMASINTQSGDQRDQANDTALSAADSGANIAIARQSDMAALLSTAKPCVKVNGTKLEAVAAESGWCPTVGPTAVGNGSYSYRVKPVYSAAGATMTVVSTGTSAAGNRAATRRLAVTASSASATPIVFGTEGVVGIDSVVMDGSATIYGDVGTNGYIEWPGDPKIKNCSKVRVGNPSGEFKKLSWQTYPSCPIVKENRTYPNVILPSTNSNSRMFTAGGDTYTYSNGAIAGCGAAAWQASWCPTTKILRLTSDAKVTLGGTAPYVFCQLILEGDAELIMAAGAHIQIIFEAPDSPGCNLANGATQMLVDNGAEIKSLSFSPKTGDYSVPGFYFVGSSTRASKVVITNGAVAGNMILYAPRTAIEVLRGGSFGGAILGKSVLMDGGTRVEPEGTGSFKPDENLPIEGSGGSSLFSRAAYVECAATPTVASEPASGC